MSDNNKNEESKKKMKVIQMTVSPSYDRTRAEYTNYLKQNKETIRNKINYGCQVAKLSLQFDVGTLFRSMITDPEVIIPEFNRITKENDICLGTMAKMETSLVNLTSRKHLNCMEVCCSWLEETGSIDDYEENLLISLLMDAYPDINWCNDGMESEVNKLVNIFVSLYKKEIENSANNCIMSMFGIMVSSL